MRNKISRLLFWYYALLKRLVKRPSFLIILALIPLFAFSVARLSSEPSGFVHIAIVSNGEESADEIIKELQADNKIARITLCDNKAEAKELVASGEADTAWIFADDLLLRAEQIAKGEPQKLVSVYLAEDNTFTRAAREKLLGSLFPLISYELYEEKAEEIGVDLSAEQLKEFYNRYGTDSLIEYGFLDSSQQAPKGSDFLTAPLRGLLCTVMLLCGLAAALYVSTDDREGTFSNLTSHKRALVFLANNLAALTLSGIFVSAALALTGNYTSFWRESLLMMLYILATTGLCTLLGALLRTPQRLAVSLPIALILSIALSPVFFNVKRLRLLQSFFPLYHYLYGVNNMRFCATLALWAVFYIAAAYYIYTYKNKGIKQ